MKPSLFVHDPALEERLDQRQHALVCDSLPHPVQRGRVRELIETRFDVSLHYPLVRARGEILDLNDRILGTASRGLNPYEQGLKSASKIGSSTSLRAA